MYLGRPRRDEGVLLQRCAVRRYDSLADRVDDGSPLPIGDGWPAFSDAYLRYDIATDAVERRLPAAGRGNWPGLAEAGIAAPDAAVAWSSGPPDGGAPT
jgi:hypothetical protein